MDQEAWCSHLNANYSEYLTGDPDNKVFFSLIDEVFA
jgi:hypothetical protein